MNDIIVRPPIRNGRIIGRGTFHSVRTSLLGKKSIHQGLDFSREYPGYLDSRLNLLSMEEIVFQGGYRAAISAGRIVVETSLDNGKILHSHNHLGSFAEPNPQGDQQPCCKSIGNMGGFRKICTDEFRF